MKDRLYEILIVLVIVIAIGSSIAVRLAIYDGDWRCLLGECRIVK